MIFEGRVGFVLFAAAGLPLALFDLTFLPFPLNLVCLLALAGAFGLSLRRFDSGVRIDLETASFCALLAIALCLLGGETHLFSPTSDWIVRDSVLRDLVMSPWPVHYDLDGHDFLLRAPLGLYLVPAAIGKILGLAAAHFALLVQNATILACLLTIFVARCESWRERLLALGLFVFFSGLDILPWAKSWAFGQDAPFDWHLDAWVDWLQYSSHITQLFWVPHHALAGWAFVAAYLSWRRGQLSAWSLGAVIALGMFWSPLAMIGALPFAAFAFLSDLRSGALKMCDAFAPGLVGSSCLPAIAYLMIDSGAVEKRWLFLDQGYPLRYLEFIFVELALWFWIFYITPRQKDEIFKSADLWIAAVSLLVLPLYFLGFSNDFTMRASIPALVLVALAAAPRVEHMLQNPGFRRVALIAGLLIAAVTPGVEIARAIVMPTTPLGNCPLPRAWQTWMHDIDIGRPAPMTSYLADSAASPLIKMLPAPAQSIADAAPCRPPIFAYPFMNYEAQTAKRDASHESQP